MSNNINDELLKVDAVLKRFPVSKSTWWEGVKSGRYPKPVRLSPRRVAWKVCDIQLLIEQSSNEEGSI